jgi:hypothetical protein
MAMEREKQMGFTYDWVFHGRIDSAWGAPVKPYFMWSKVSEDESDHC